MTWRVCITNLDLEITAEAEETLHESFLRHGYQMRTSCRNGVCEICEVVLEQGQVIQRYPEAQLALEKGDPPATIYVCTAKALSDLRIRAVGLSKIE